MTFGRAAALLYAAVSAGIVAFQIALAAGAPWGAYAMGGVFPGQFPLALRIAALAQAALIAGMAAVVMSRAGLVLAFESPWNTCPGDPFLPPDEMSSVGVHMTPASGSKMDARRKVC